MNTYEGIEYDHVVFIFRYNPLVQGEEEETDKYPFRTVEEARVFVYNVTHEFDLETRTRIYNTSKLYLLSEEGDKVAFLNWYPNNNIFSGVLKSTI